MIHTIEIKVHRIGQLFNSLDPSPFLEKDLDDDAVAYIFASVAQHKLKYEQRIIIHVPKHESKKITELELKEAIHRHFEYQADLSTRNLRSKMREGQLSLTIGVSFLALCLIMRSLLLNNPESIWKDLFGEGLLIAGWVAMWKPISTFLYDWWPLVKERKINEKISKMEIELMLF